MERKSLQVIDQADLQHRDKESPGTQTLATVFLKFYMKSNASVLPIESLGLNIYFWSKFYRKKSVQGAGAGAANWAGDVSNTFVSSKIPAIPY